jgi:hypothetical protein
MPKTPAPTPAPEPAEKPRIGTRQLVHLAYILREDRAKLDAQIAEVEAAIIERGPGKHSSDNPDQVITVVAGAAPSEGKISYALPAEKEDAARELSLDKFGVLFKRTVTFTPIEGFENVAPTHLTPAKSRDLLALCAVQGKPFAGRKPSLRYA